MVQEHLRVNMKVRYSRLVIIIVIMMVDRGSWSE